MELWHKRLSHINDRGLQELQKQGLLGDLNNKRLVYSMSNV